MTKLIRSIPGDQVQDPSSIAAIEFSESAGSQKVSEVGRHLLPIPYISAGVEAYTTDASTARRLPTAGKCLAVYNNDTAVASITLGSGVSAPVSLGVGATDANGHVGIPCKPSDWTYIACDSNVWVISSAATLLVFIIDDRTAVKVEALR
jgi:hypothetical protein